MRYVSQLEDDTDMELRLRDGSAPGALFSVPHIIEVFTIIPKSLREMYLLMTLCCSVPKPSFLSYYCKKLFDSGIKCSVLSNILLGKCVICTMFLHTPTIACSVWLAVLIADCTYGWSVVLLYLCQQGLSVLFAALGRLILFCRRD